MKNKIKNRFRILAGITQKDTLAIIKMPKIGETIELKYIPSFFERLKYMLCGFKCDIVRKDPVHDTFTFFEKLKYSLCGSKCDIIVEEPSCDTTQSALDEKEIDELIVELENEQKN
jgi:hypothetical protein